MKKKRYRPIVGFLPLGTGGSGNPLGSPNVSGATCLRWVRPLFVTRCLQINLSVVLGAEVRL
jgi:hypothetical protein